MFERNDEITKRVDAVYALFDDAVRGDLIVWSRIEAACGFSRGQELYSIVARVKKRLRRERGIVAWCKVGVGVRLLTHSEATREVPAARQRRAARQIHRGLTELDCVETGAISTHERRVLEAQKRAMRDERRTLRKSVRSFEKDMRTEALPRRRHVPS